MDGTWTNQAITVTAAGSTDDLTPTNELIYQYSLDGINYLSGNSVELTDDGIQTVYFKVIDGSGQTTVVDKTIKIDQTVSSMPTITMTSGEAAYQAGTWATDRVTFTLSEATDATSGVAKYQYQIDNGQWIDGTTSTFTDSGEYTVNYRSIDNAGNISAVGTKSIKVDLEAPLAPEMLTSPEYLDGSWTDKNIIVSAINATDNMTLAADLIYQYSLDGSNYQSGNRIELDSDGIHMVYFKVTDASGQSVVVTKTVSIDQTNPTTPLITMQSGGVAYQAGTWATDNVTVTLSGATDATSGIAKYQYQIDGGEWLDGTIYTFTKSGKYSLAVRSIDQAGNISAIDSVIINVDLEAPEAFAITASSTTIGTIDLQAATTDLMSGMAASSYRIFDGHQWSNWLETVDQTLTGYKRGEVAEIRVEAKDQAGNIQTTTIEVETLMNTAPEAANDSYALTEDDNATTLAVLANDSDSDIATELGDTLEVVEVTGLSNPKAGVLTLEAGVVTFSPAKDFNGTISFEYTIADELGATASASAELTVNPVNDQPVASNDAATTQEEKAVTIDVLANDVDVDSNLTIKSFTKPSHGTVVKAGNGLKYTPAKDFYGVDTFKYTVTDSCYEATATVVINVTNVNDKPVLTDDAAKTYLNQEVTIDVLANDSDIETTSLKIATVSVPENGVATIVDNKVVYQPDEGFVGTDIFSYTVNDNGLKVSATITVTVAYPEFYDEGTIIVHPNPGGGSGGGTTDLPAGPATKPEIKVTSEPKKGQYEVVGGDVYYKPETGETGIDNYNIEIDGTEYEVITNIDDEGNANPIGYGIPLIKDDYSVNQNTSRSINLEEVLDNYDDITKITINGSPANGTVEIIDGQLIYTPDEDFVGGDGVVITVEIDGQEIPFAATFAVSEVGGFPYGLPFLFLWVILLILNYLRHRKYYNEKMVRVNVYTIAGLLVVAGLYFALPTLGNLITNGILIVYVLANYAGASHYSVCVK